MPPRTLKISETFTKLRGWAIAPPKPYGEKTPSERAYRISRDSESVTSQVVPLNYDVLLNIAEHLISSSDRLALAKVSRWHYYSLRHTLYAYAVLSEDVRIASLVEQLLASELLSSVIQHVDIIFPPAYTYQPYAMQGSEGYYARRKYFLEGVFIVLKLATRLKTLFLHHYSHNSYAQMDLLGMYISDLYPFSLKSLSTQTIEGTRRLLERQPQLERLVLFPCPRYHHATRPIPPVPSIDLARLHTLWATSWWSSIILPCSPVRTLGLLTADIGAREPLFWRTVFQGLSKAGGHTFVTQLAVPYECFFWDHGPQVLDQDLFAEAFPRVTKICIIPHGLSTERIENTATDLGYAENLAKRYTTLPWPAVRELVFLRPGDDWPNPYDKPYTIKKAGKNCEKELVTALEGLFPHLMHIDLTWSCYKKTAEGNEWNVRPRMCQH